MFLQINLSDFFDKDAQAMIKVKTYNIYYRRLNFQRSRIDFQHEETFSLYCLCFWGEEIHKTSHFQGLRTRSHIQFSLLKTILTKFTSICLASCHSVVMLSRFSNTQHILVDLYGNFEIPLCPKPYKYDCVLKRPSCVCMWIRT